MTPPPRAPRPFRKKPEHTPGPWTASEETTNSITIRANGVEIASVYNEEIDRTSREQRATARLIAAAPEMLVQLREWAALDCGELAPIGKCGACMTCKAHALLAQIEGRAKGEGVVR